MDRETAQPVPFGRLAALDLGRGLIMLLMALDHANSMAGLGTQRGGEFWGGQFPDYASLPAFLTRAVSHMCAPGFALLMGAGMALLALRMRGTDGNIIGMVGRFALRGAMLIALQFTLENWAWRLGAGFPYGGGIYVGVLAMLGTCMLLTGPLARMNAGALLTLALAAMGLGWLLLPPFAD
ncbi:heparan-alpha-glucosaminide N-acetyltransferase domain-containing protein, partial [Desulfocurvibacter africanus]|uniref:heparan-alpha-glucosaminide N-acetyltransferase domain-containing protein n=1 Tax=Desulfocurvibacter africanus TaxID=873 RepID=UPI002FDB094E